jgi:putative photosynthetic complex assembly protein 2
MIDIALPALVTVFAWWFSTGVILLLDRLRPETFRRSMAWATAVLAAALSGLWLVAGETTPAAAYVGFFCGLAVWGWIELSFLTGIITGPRREGCPAGARGVRRFGAALAAILWHEVAILLGAALVLALSWGQPNQVGAWTFMILWVMRQSAKLNIFLGARNTGRAFLPEHLRYIGTYFRSRPMNMLFPFSVTAGTLFCTWLFHRALAPGATAFDVVAAGLLGTLAALAVLEHWFLMLPLRIEALWRWAMECRAARGASAARSAAWEPGRAAPCDAERLGRLLDDVADGAYGRVERLHGTLPATTGWLRFQIAEGRSSVERLAPERGLAPHVVAVGPRLDVVRLRAALDACLAPVPA